MRGELTIKKLNVYSALFSQIYTDQSSELYKNNIQDQKRAVFITPLLTDRGLEEIFNLYLY